MQPSYDTFQPTNTIHGHYEVMLTAVVLQCIGLILNLFFMLVLVGSFKSMMKSSNLFLSFNLAIANTTFYITSLNYSIRFVMNTYQPMDSYYASLQGVFAFSTVGYSLCSVTLIAMDRYFIIVKEKYISIRMFSYLIFVNTFVTVLFSVLPVFILDAPYILSVSGTYFTLNINDPNSIGLLLLGADLIVIFLYESIIVYCYGSIVLHVRGSLFQSFQKHALTSTIQRRRSSSLLYIRTTFQPYHRPKPCSHKPSLLSLHPTSKAIIPTVQPKFTRDLELSVAQKAIVLVTSHTLAFTPFVICSICDIFHWPLVIQKGLDTVTFMLLVINSMVNPIFSFIMDVKIRVLVRRFLRRFKKRRKK